MKVRSALSRRNAIAGGCLKRCATAVTEVGPDRWSFVLSNGSLLPVLARATEDWLTLEAPIDADQADSGSEPPAWTWLGLNARLAGLGKIALLPYSHALCLRADIPLDEGVDLTARVRESCAAFVHASHAIGIGHAPEDELEPSAAGSSSADRKTDLAGLCREAGWAFVERDGGLLVDLGTGRDTEQARVERRPDGDVHASVQVVRSDALTPVSREALGAFLLTTCAVVRLARAAVQEATGAAVARFEVRYAAPACAVEIGHALSALSVAYGLFGREAQALLDDRVAREYLAMRGGCRAEAVSTPH